MATRVGMACQHLLRRDVSRRPSGVRRYRWLTTARLLFLAVWNGALTDVALNQALRNNPYPPWCISAATAPTSMDPIRPLLACG
jgi:hypothetical protein